MTREREELAGTRGRDAAPAPSGRAGDGPGGGDPGRGRAAPAAHAGPSTPPGADRPRALRLDLVWKREFQFVATGRGGVEVVIDGDGELGPSPMETLLAALGSCAATDVVDILRKSRRPPRALSVRLTGERREEAPRRFTRIRAEVRIGGDVDRPRAERAVRLAFEKYCSVRASLDPSIPIEIDLHLEP